MKLIANGQSIILSTCTCFRQEKVLISFPRVERDFKMSSPYFRRSCFYCDAPAQKMSLVYNDLPSSLVAHFVDGLHERDLRRYDFTLAGGGHCSYVVTCVVQHVTDPSHHFIAWVRQNKDGKCMYGGIYLENLFL